MDSTVTNGDLQSLGAVLKHAREQQALTFEEVELQTRIRVKFLQALENGDLSLLPSLAHARGFLRNYAQFLRLDANVIIASFGELTGTSVPSTTTSTAFSEPTPPPAGRSEDAPTAPAFDQEATVPPYAPPPMTPYPLPEASRSRATYIAPDQRVGPGAPTGVPSPPPRSHKYQTPAYGVAIPAAAPEVIQPDRPQTPARRLLQSNLITGVILSIGVIAIVVWTITQLSAVSSSGLVQTPEAGLDSSQSANATLDLTPSPGTTPTETVAGAGPSVPLDRVLLSITVTRRTWAEIIVDGKTEFQGQAQGGQVFEYQALTSIVVLVGDASAFDVTYNGQHLGLLGDPGQVVSRTFTTSGQITPTPTMTITPTETSVPSPTPRGTQTATPKP
jgi:Helix-turn-helix domain/RodZ C-terminal domain